MACLFDGRTHLWRKSINRLASAAAAAIVLFSAASGVAKTWPTKAVTMIVAASVGSAPDIIARIVADRLEKRWGQTVVINNRPGAAGNIGTAAGAEARPDGYTLLFTQAAPLVLNRFTFARLPFNVGRDFEPIITVGISPLIVAVGPDSPAKTLAELIALARRHPTDLNFASVGSRNIPHLAGQLISAMAHIKFVHVAYRNSQTAIADLLAGRVQVLIDGTASLLPLVQDKRLRALAVTSKRRLPGLQRIATVAETLPGYDVTGWFAVVVPTGTPRQIGDEVNRALQDVLRQPDIAARFGALGTYPVGGSREQLTQFIKAHSEALERAARSAGLEKK